MRSRYSRRDTFISWFIVYEFSSVLVSLVAATYLFHRGCVGPIGSIEFIKSNSPFYSILSIWLSNLTSFLIGGVLVLIHPILGLLSVILNSWFLGEILASFFAGHLHLAHFIYSIIETQAYVILWLLVVEMHIVWRRHGDLLSKWRATIKYVEKIIIVSVMIFLLLSMVEVAEVLTYG